GRRPEGGHGLLRSEKPAGAEGEDPVHPDHRRLSPGKPSPRRADHQGSAQLSHLTVVIRRNSLRFFLEKRPANRGCPPALFFFSMMAKIPLPRFSFPPDFCKLKIGSGEDRKTDGVTASEPRGVSGIIAFRAVFKPGWLSDMVFGGGAFERSPVPPVSQDDGGVFDGGSVSGDCGGPRSGFGGGTLSGSEGQGPCGDGV